MYYPYYIRIFVFFDVFFSVCCSLCRLVEVVSACACHVNFNFEQEMKHSRRCLKRRNNNNNKSSSSNNNIN